MRRRLDIAGALVAAPPVLILDEPTTGLDPVSRQQMWTVIRQLVTDGATLLLTTQYLEEADVLADRIVVIDKGRSIAEGTADELKSQIGGERIELVIADDSRLPAAREVLAAVATGEVRDAGFGRGISAAVADEGAGDLVRVLQELERQRIDVLEAGLRRPTLDDVFLTLTGHAAEEASAPETEEVPA